jgi:hypothetical protein
MKKSTLEDLEREKKNVLQDKEDWDTFGLFGLFLLWYLYKEAKKQAMKEYLQQLSNDEDYELDNDLEDEKVLVKRR